MVDYGFIARNDNSDLQIDSEFECYVKRDEGSTGSFTTYVWVETTGLWADSLFLIRPDTDRFVTLQYFRNAIPGTQYRIITEYGQTTDIDWQAYSDTYRWPLSETQGLRVYNDKQAALFDSGWDLLKIYTVEDITLSDPTYSTYPYTDITHSGISDPFYLLGTSSRFVNQYYDGVSYYCREKYVGIKKLSSTSVRVGWFLTSSGGAQVNPCSTLAYNNPVVLAVCDVR